MNIIPLIENIKFCRIATQIQDALAVSPVLRAEDRDLLDSQLSQWYENLPWILRSTEPCPESIYTARSVMKWRYQNLRIVLFRPVLLNLANRSTKGSSPNQEDLAAVAKLRAIAKQTIEDIAHEWTPNQMLGWNGVWFMYQASMIPLVTIFWEIWNTQQVQECQQQIQTVLEAMEGMSDWSLAARRSREVLVKMYEASKRPLTRHASPGLTPAMMNSSTMVMGSNGELLDMQQQGPQFHQQADIANGEEGLSAVMVDGGQHLWDIDGMIWGGLPEGYDMPYDGAQYDGFEGQEIQHEGMMYKYETGDGTGDGYMMQQ
jgi:hypothetical protein